MMKHKKRRAVRDRLLAAEARLVLAQGEASRYHAEAREAQAVIRQVAEALGLGPDARVEEILAAARRPKE